MYTPLGYIMDRQSEQFWQTIDDHLLDALQLIRARWTNFNSIPIVDKLVRQINEAYRSSGTAADMEDRGFIE